MTITQALEKAEECVRLSGDENTREIIEKLTLCRENLHTMQWTRRTALDACEQFVLEQQRELSVSDLNRPRLPRHTTIQRLFGMSAAKFRDTYFPSNAHAPGRGSKYSAVSQEDIISLFRAEYLRMMPTGAADFSRRYDNSRCPHWQTVCRYCGLKRQWKGLITALNLPVFEGNASLRQRRRKDDGAAYQTDSSSRLHDRWRSAQGHKQAISRSRKD